MRRSILVMLVIGTAASLGACSQHPAKSASAKEERVNCLKETGSRIPPPQGKCIEAPGQVLTRDEIGRTGEVNTADAIRKLVPSAR